MANKKRNDNGSIAKTQSGKWKATATVGYNNDGGQVRKSKTFKTKGDANSWLMEMCLNPNNLDFKNGDVTFDKISKLWLAHCKDKGVEQSALITYGSSVKKIEEYPYIFNAKIKDIRKMHIEKMINDLARNYSENYVKTIKNNVSAIFIFTVGNDIIAKNPASLIDMPHNFKETKKKDGFNEYEVETIEKYYDQFNFGDIVYIMINTGMRTQEICALNENDLENHKLNITKAMKRTNSNMWIVGKTKTKTSVRCNPVTDKVYELLKRRALLSKVQLDSNGNKLPRNLLCDIQGNIISYPMFKYWYKLFIDKLNSFLVKNKLKEVRYLPPHCCRHTFASRKEREGVNPYVVASLLGHTQIEQTAAYTHVTEIQKENAINNLQAPLSTVYEENNAIIN